MPYADGDHKRRADRDRLKEKRQDKQDISKVVGAVKNPRRRKAALAALRVFCETYFPNRFNRPWSEDHLQVIAIMEQTARSGGIFPIAMPRGSGKTAMCIGLVFWSILSGLSEFGLVIGANKAAALEILDSIKKEIETNDLLLQDFPREIGPFRLLEGEARRAAGQRWKSKRTFISWKAMELIFAEVPSSKAAGAVVRVAGITGRIRGMQFTKKDGRQIGPSLVIADDPQDDQSARSIGKTDFRERVLLSTVKGLARTGVRIGIIIPCTVIRKGDLADRLMDRALHPDIAAKRTKMLYALPKNLDLWEQYSRIFSDDRAVGGDGAAGTRFYVAHRAAMDCGAIVGWEHNFDPGEASAVEHAMRWYLFNRGGFFAECQQEPLEEHISTGRLTVEDVFAKLNGRPRLVVPMQCEWITAMTDVNEGLLYYWVSAWERDFTGYRLDCGAWPEQPDRWYTMASARKPLTSAYPGKGKDGAVYAGLEALLLKLFATEYRREDGASMALDLAGVDSRFDQEIVANVIRAVGRGKQLLPTMGVGFQAASKPYAHYKPEPGATLGRNWRKAVAPKTQLITLSMDVNRWKSFYRDRVRVPKGAPGCYSFCGDPKRPQDEKMVAEHHVAEFPTLTSGPYGEIEIWKHDRKFDNHLWDTAIGACVLASVLPGGPKLPEWERGPWRGKRKENSGGHQAVAYL
jgi:hypothetical protein